MYMYFYGTINLYHQLNTGNDLHYNLGMNTKQLCKNHRKMIDVLNVTQQESQITEMTIRC